MTQTTAQHILQKYWGYTRFRPMQEQIIQSVLDGQDTLALLPTGGGKSICYQVPALVNQGVCLVISPLIALMKDQVEQLQAKNIPAIAIYSGMSRRDIDRHFDNAIYGKTKLFYCSPERLQTDMGRERIQRMPLSFIAVDEAHCISQWGYDFRPSYLKIKELREMHPQVPILALTATATPTVVDDIQKQLTFDDGAVFTASMERTNIALQVDRVESKEATLANLLESSEGTAIVYARNRRLCQITARQLQGRGLSADYYHAGLSHEQRIHRQEAWMSGKTRIMVATNAFGMGIDKSDVRLVLHLDVPDSLEAYVQEAGRAGRDGQPSEAWLLFREKDIDKLYDWFYLTYPSMREIRQVYQFLCDYYQLAVGAEVYEAMPFNLSEFANRFQLSAVKTYYALKVLEQDGWFSLSDAVINRSKVQITGPREEVFKYQQGDSLQARVLQGLLRLYEGTYQSPVNIHERQLAQYCDADEKNIKKALHHLKQSELIDYQPVSDDPLLSWLNTRVPAKDVQIDMEMYRFRKNRHWERIKAMEAYVKLPVCRRNFILYYFGEKPEGVCGQCDVCKRTTRSTFDNELFEDVYFRLEDCLGPGGAVMDDVKEKCKDLDEDEVLRVLEYLQNEEFIVQDREMLTWNRETT